MKVLFLTHTLGGGGAERVLVNLVNHMDKSKYDITVKTLFGGGVNAERLDKTITYHCGHFRSFKGISRVLSVIPPSLLYRHYVGNEQYDMVIAYMHGLPTHIVLGAPKGAKKISWLHCGSMEDTSMFHSFVNMKSAIRSLRKLDAIVCVAKQAQREFSRVTGLTENVFTRYNTNETAEILEKSKKEISIQLPEGRIICSVGRFTQEKGFERLVRISKRLNEEGFSHTLLLIGGGQLLNSLKEQTTVSGYDKVIFAGFQSNPYAYMTRADMFVCSSYFEGLSTATTEALILGLPCVSTNVSGAREILGENNEYGFVVENSEEGLYEGIKQMYQSIEDGSFDRTKSAVQAEKFSVHATVEKVEELLDSIMEK